MSENIPGPCVMCGATNYALSYGGPTICPVCDCGGAEAGLRVRLAAAVERAEKAEKAYQQLAVTRALAVWDHAAELKAKAEVMARLEKAEAVVARLPKDHDGNPMMLGDSAWFPFNFYGEPHEPVEGCVVEAEDSEGGKYAVWLALPGHNPAMRTIVEKAVAECYATAAAATAAKKGN